MLVCIASDLSTKPERTMNKTYDRTKQDLALDPTVEARAARVQHALEPSASEAQVREQVEAALKGQAAADARSIRIEVTGGKVTLTGYASSWQSIEDAAHAAWAAPGVTEVIDQVHRRMTY